MPGGGQGRQFELALEVQRWTRARSGCLPGGKNYSYATVNFFCSLDVLDPRVGHTMDVVSLLISVLCHSD